MTKTTPGAFYPVWYSVQNGICDFLNTPTMWSDEFVKATLERGQTKTYNTEDCRNLIKDYLAVVSDYVRHCGPTNYPY